MWTLLFLLPLTAGASPFSIHGTVTSFRDGARLEDANVFVYQNGFLLAWATTSASGDYSIEDDWDPQLGGEATVEAYAYGYLPIDQPFDPTQSDTLADFVLHGTARISGTVVDADSGSPALNTFVRILHQEGSAPEWIQFSTTGTSANGEYAAAGLPAGTYRVCVDGVRNGKVRQCFDGVDVATLADIDSATPIVVAEDEVRGDVNFVRHSGSAIVGNLVDSASGHGIADIDVKLELYDSTGKLIDEGIVRTDSAGAYRLQGVAHGAFYLSARVDSNGFAAKQLFKNVDCPSWTCPPATTGQPVNVIDGASTEGINFTFSPDAIVRGRVDDAAGKPLGGVKIVACHESLMLMCDFMAESSSTDGSYTLYVKSGASYTFTARGGNANVDQMYPNVPCYQYCGRDDDGGTSTIPISAGDHIDGINFSLARASFLSGKVLDGTGNPVQSAEIIAYDAAYRRVWQTSTNEDGLYTSDKWLPGTYYVQMTYGWPGYCVFYVNQACPEGNDPIPPLNSTPVVVAPGETRHGVDFVLLEPYIFVDGFENATTP